MSLPLVSVVIPTYNRLDFLKEAIFSVKKQAFNNYELLIVDDASSDGTWDWLQSLQDDRIRVFRFESNQYVSAARNKGLSEALGEFIMFLDDDDLLLPQALKKLVKPLKKDSQIVATIGGRWKFKKDVYRMKRPHPIMSFQKVIWPELLAGWSSVSGQNLYRTKIVKKVDGYREELRRINDRDLWLKVAKLGSVAVIPDFVMEYRDHGISRVPRNAEEIRESIYQEFIASLPDEEKARARQIRKSANLSKKADIEYKSGNYKDALDFSVEACKASPELLLSPLTGTGLTSTVAKSFLKSLPTLFA